MHAGGPGKGMHSRLYTRVLNQYPWMHNCTAINSIYNSSGLVGIFASVESSHAGGRNPPGRAGLWAVVGVRWSRCRC